MANVYDRYGVKEVMDVTFYEIGDNGSAAAPVLFLDTLKVSTIEETASSSDATGGKGNSPLVSWDYGREINVTLEDALMSMKSMSLMFNSPIADTTSVPGSAYWTALTSSTPWPTAGTSPIPTDATNIKIYDGVSLVDTTTTLSPTAGQKYLISWVISVSSELKNTITIGANTWPKTYYVTGDTFIRNAATGKDERYMIIIPKAKLQPGNTFTFQADGDPTVFSLKLKVLRPDDGNMVKFIRYPNSAS